MARHLGASQVNSPHSCRGVPRGSIRGSWGQLARRREGRYMHSSGAISGAVSQSAACSKRKFSLHSGSARTKMAAHLTHVFARTPRPAPHPAAHPPPQTLKRKCPNCSWKSGKENACTFVFSSFSSHFSRKLALWKGEKFNSSRSTIFTWLQESFPFDFWLCVCVRVCMLASVYSCACVCVFELLHKTFFWSLDLFWPGWAWAWIGARGMACGARVSGFRVQRLALASSLPAAGSFCLSPANSKCSNCSRITAGFVLVAGQLRI